MGWRDPPVQGRMYRGKHKKTKNPSRTDGGTLASAVCVGSWKGSSVARYTLDGCIELVRLTGVTQRGHGRTRNRFAGLFNQRELLLLSLGAFFNLLMRFFMFCKKTMPDIFRKQTICSLNDRCCLKFSNSNTDIFLTPSLKESNE